MNVTRDVINDLWPVFAADEASADTRALVEAFLLQDSEFAGLVRDQGDQGMLQQAIPGLPPDQEARALRRTKRLLHGWDWTLFLAILFTCFAFGRIIADTSWDTSPKNFIIAAVIAALFWIAFFVRIAWLRRRVFGPRI